MKKIFTLIGALVGFASISSAATVDDIAPLKHSYVLVCDDWNNSGTEKIAKGALYGNGFFFTPTGHDCSVKKGSVNLSVVNEADDNHVTADIAAKYGQDYNVDQFNSLRLKNNQDIMVMKVTAGSKIIFFLQGNNKTGKEARIPKLWKGGEGGVQSKDDCGDANALNPKPTEDHPTTDAGFRFEYTVDDDMTLWVGSWNGDMFLSYVIIEANEAEGTPSVKVGQQTFEDGLWFKEVTVTPREAYGITTDVYYTTDGTEPTADSQKYTAPIKCYKEMTLKFQAFVMGTPVPDANNEASVNFSFDAPTIDAEGANVTITSTYEGAKNFYTLNGGEAQEGNTVTLTESATVTAYSQIVNGSYTTFTTKTTTKDVYVLNPIKDKKVIEVIAGDVVLDEEATATSTTGEVYTIENGEISADKMDFFVKNLTFKALKDEQYQVPAGNERYIQMSNTNITFFVAEGDSVDVKVVCSKNSCKNIDANDAEDGSQVTDRKCYVNVSGTNYCLKDEEGNETNDLKLYPNANEFTFGLKGAEGGSYFTFQKYSGTGNILISSIEITPASAQPETDPNELVINGDCEGEDGTCLVVKHGDGGGGFTTNFVAGAGIDGSRAAVIHAVDNAVNEWDTQFFIVANNHTFALGEKYVVKFWVKADKAAKISVQGHKAPGDYLTWYVDGAADVNVTTEWQEVTWAGTVNDSMAQFGGNMEGMQTLAFNLNNDKTLENNYYFDNISWKLVTENGIETTQIVKVQNGAIYNLAGQKVDANYKGVVIVNGKKMLQK